MNETDKGPEGNSSTTEVQYAEKYTQYTCYGLLCADHFIAITASGYQVTHTWCSDLAYIIPGLC